jgi:hypothetical protein
LLATDINPNRHIKLSGTSKLTVEVPLGESGNPTGPEFMTIVGLIE